jgi:hypothetical protein
MLLGCNCLFLSLFANSFDVADQTAAQILQGGFVRIAVIGFKTGGGSQWQITSVGLVTQTGYLITNS